METIFFSLVRQLLHQSPLFLAYFVGIILALVFWRRYPRPSMLVLLAMVLFVATRVIWSVLFLFVLRGRESFNWTTTQLGWIMWAQGFVGNVVHAGIFGLLLAAVFISRKVTPQPKPDEPVQFTRSAVPPTDEEGITNRPRGV